ncbi:hypothetical protein H0O00_04685 [Candidatus Micrarchaeota archaeon]|nr:hypothetical protein [Candidatus Micrarchaeota archaeon]
MIPNLYSKSSKGVISLDALFSLLPLLIMLVLVMDTEAMIVRQAEDASHRQQVFDKLASVADYTVKIGAVVREGDIRYPNWVDETNITNAYTTHPATPTSNSYADSLRERAGLRSLYIGFDGPSDSSGASDSSQICIYRLVVVGDDKTIERLFVCGG